MTETCHNSLSCHSLLSPLWAELQTLISIIRARLSLKLVLNDYLFLCVCVTYVYMNLRGQINDKKTAPPVWTACVQYMQQWSVRISFPDVCSVSVGSAGSPPSFTIKQTRMYTAHMIMEVWPSRKMSVFCRPAHWSHCDTDQNTSQLLLWVCTDKTRRAATNSVLFHPGMRSHPAPHRRFDKLTVTLNC